MTFFDVINQDSIDEDHPSEAPTEAFPGLVLIGDRDHVTLRELLADSDACPWVFDELRRRNGTIGDVVIAVWIGTICNSNGKRMLEALQYAGEDRLLAVEDPSTSSDQVVRWMTRWSRELPPPVVNLQILRAPFGQPANPMKGDGPQTSTAVLLAGGYSAVTLDDVDRRAAEDRASGADVLAGRLWEEAGVTDIGHGIAAFPASRLARSRLPPVEDSPAGVWDLQPTGQPG